MAMLLLCVQLGILEDLLELTKGLTKQESAWMAQSLRYLWREHSNLLLSFVWLGLRFSTKVGKRSRMKLKKSLRGQYTGFRAHKFWLVSSCGRARKLVDNWSVFRSVNEASFLQGSLANKNTMMTPVIPLFIAPFKRLLPYLPRHLLQSPPVSYSEFISVYL